jgi:hypothetical protein
VGGKTVLCYPIIFSGPDFYLSHDMALLTTDIRSELQFIGMFPYITNLPWPSF